MGRSNWYNSTYTFLGRPPLLTGLSISPLSGTSYIPVLTSVHQLGYCTYCDGAWYGVPTSWLWNYGDGYSVATLSGISNHTYTVGGAYNISVVPSNVWGTGNASYINFVVFPTPPASTVKWVNSQGATITSIYSGETPTFVFNTVSNGAAGTISPISYVIDEFYVDVYKKDVNTGNWVLEGVKTLYVKPSGYYSFATMNTSFGMLAQGLYSWEGYMPITTGAQEEVQYNAGVRGVNVTNATLYPAVSLGNVSVTVYKNPLIASNLGAATLDIGGWGLNIVLAAIIVIILMMIPFLMTREFNLFLSLLMGMIGVGLSYFLGLVEIYVVVGLIVISIIVIFFMNRMGGGGGEGSSDGDVG